MRENKKLTLMEHLLELRSRLMRAGVAVLITTVLAFVINDYNNQRVTRLLLRPLELAGQKPVFLDITEMFGVYFKVTFLLAIAIALPVIIYELMMFILPGLTERERRFIFWILPSAAVLFIFGASFSYFVFLPPATRFLIYFGQNIATPQIRISSYISIVAKLLFFSGLVFELPLVVSFLARLGVVNYRGLSRFRPWMIVLAFIFGAIVTPTFDPINQTLMALPAIILFELSIWLARLLAPRRALRISEAKE